ncbi:hypothetical protein PybrP1_003095 [[Pythium] brassicae (nom. inval.)]|nr:hypothetical protein PybrP1_003095 [[Pythium] brassicae (nom. inval.)]
MAGTRLHVVVSFVLFALAVAPFAWRFTQIERVELPVARIRRLSFQDSRFAQPEAFAIAVFSLDSQTPKSQALAAVGGDNGARVTFTPVETLEATPAQRQALLRATSLQELDDRLAPLAPPDRFSILLLCSAAPPVAIAASGADANALVVGRHRHAWSTQCAFPRGSALVRAAEALALEHVFPSAASSESTAGKRAARTAVRYRLQFALLKENAQLAWRWPFANALFPRFLGRFVAKVSVLANFTVESEVLHYARLAKEIHATSDGSAFYVKADDLKQFKSANDFLTSTVLDDREQVLHFMAALPALEHSPLGIQASDEPGRLASAFEIPGWGGVAILNTTRLLSGRAEDAALEVKKLMGVFLTQLRTLLGAPSFHERQRAAARDPRAKLVFLPSPRDGIADWEIDVIARARFKHYLRASITTLQSIVQLVDEMTQMSVLERVQQRVEAAVTLIEDILCTGAELELATRQCAASADLHALLAKAREAADHTDAAYYDHTMIRQLYFPQEQMFGVYAPLLAPLILPFFVGLVREFRRWKKKKAEKLKGASA